MGTDREGEQVIGHRDEVIAEEQLLAGRYWIGDLCYVMHDVWDEVCDMLFDGRHDSGCNQGVFTLNDGRQFAMYNTQYGDGSYRDQNGNKYGVDSGSIGCILLSDIAKSEEKNIGLGSTHQFGSPVSTGRTKEGLIWFSSGPQQHVGIVTGDDYDAYEDEDE